MQLMHYQNPETIIYMPGMFAGGWIWSLAQQYACNADQIVINEALCEIDDNIDGLVRLFCSELRKLDNKLVLVGNSLGSLIALYTAIELGDQVSRVVISGSAGFEEVKLDKYGFKFDRRNPNSSAMRLAELIFYDKSVIASPHFETFQQTFAQNMISIMRLMGESNRAIVAPELLENIQCPVHAIWGENDVITPLSAAEGTLKRLNVSIDVIQECGHSPMCEQPEKFVGCLNKINKAICV